VITVEVKEAAAREQSGTVKNGPRTGQAYSFRKQAGYVNTGGHYPEQITLQLADGQEPYPVGFYTLAPNSCYVGEYGALLLRKTVHLVPLEEALRNARTPKAVAA
jgi:hypothetical protein